ncbi:tyrosine-type recombinase/integrase [Candidatus Microgenomates bacterium]|nr:tyrosine-type recombinase/integrase [Candidatus Microgenomates bacterium]
MEIKTLLQEFCDYALYARGRSNNTIKGYRFIANLFCKDTGVAEIEDITTDLVRNWFYLGRKDRKWAPACSISYHKNLTVFFRWCLDNGYLKSNPCDDVELPKLDKRLPPKLTKQDSAKLLEFVYNYPYNYRFLRFRNHAIFATFIFAGLRKAELLNLKYTDVDIENMSIFIRQGKGNKDRIVPMCYSLSTILRKYLDERKRLHKTCPEFFASLNRNMGFCDSGLRNLTVKMREESGIKFGIHKLRHTFATLMLEGGCDIFSLSKMMGHSDIKTTTIYLAASVEHLRKQILNHPLNNL